MQLRMLLEFMRENSGMVKEIKGGCVQVFQGGKEANFYTAQNQFWFKTIVWDDVVKFYYPKVDSPNEVSYTIYDAISHAGNIEELPRKEIVEVLRCSLGGA